ncbi:ubiquinol oxidase subunit II [Lichenibacterium ramalinae]|uniref:Ubiquinol oxidase subunit 2 n=1 Tax=Lichenibacterium ramalinae TaxID=2316527 RepID=A0A4Q2R9W8_9HYPH|nr:ubiquinol oxidase subunit II [Lichenibacterium ramalinae]RYB02330.1 ubiquinol oxidase subunit II [Lichenibacterium ramalinae]
MDPGRHGRRGRIGRGWRILGRVAAVSAAGLALSGCTGILAPRGPVGGAERTILFDSIAIMLAIIVPTMIGTLAFAWWYRESNTKATYRPDWAYSGRIELVVWSVPLLTIIFLGGIAWVGSHDLDPAKPLASDKKPVVVQVVSLDWKWLFIYPEQHIATVNQLVIPVGTPVDFSLTSSSVWNSFFITQLGSMIYTMKGMTSRLNLQADHEGTYHGLSTHFSGDGFPDMQFETRAVSPDAFQAWVAEAQGGGGQGGGGQTLDDRLYRDLTKQSVADAPKTYHAVADGLFERVVSGKLPPGPGPNAPTGGTPPDVTPKGGTM